MDEKVDRRIRKTRTILRQNLTDLLHEKELKDITVKELSERSDINRGTFYLHYKDVFDMMSQLEAELIEEFNSILTKCIMNTTPGDPYPVLIEVYRFLDANNDITRVLLGPHGDMNFLNSMKELVKKHFQYVWTTLEMNTANFEFYYSYCISGILGLIECWLLTENNRTPEEMAELTKGIILRTMDLFTE